MDEQESIYKTDISDLLEYLESDTELVKNVSEEIKKSISKSPEEMKAKISSMALNVIIPDSNRVAFVFKIIPKE